MTDIELSAIESKELIEFTNIIAKTPFLDTNDKMKIISSLKSSYKADIFILNLQGLGEVLFNGKESDVFTDLICFLKENLPFDNLGEEAKIHAEMLYKEWGDQYPIAKKWIKKITICFEDKDCILFIETIPIYHLDACQGFDKNPIDGCQGCDKNPKYGLSFKWKWEE